MFWVACCCLSKYLESFIILVPTVQQVAVSVRVESAEEAKVASFTVQKSFQRPMIENSDIPKTTTFGCRNGVTVVLLWGGKKRKRT